MSIDFQPDFIENNKFDMLACDASPFVGGEAPKIYIRGKGWVEDYKLNTFDYGYAITCHKSQGSEFKKIIVFEEVLNASMHHKWLYTAVTRASEKLIIVR
jgi:exodeoxyribonuclease-5